VAFKLTKAVLINILAVALLLVGVPLISHLLVKYSDLLEPGTYNGLGESDIPVSEFRYVSEVIDNGEGQVLTLSVAPGLGYVWNNCSVAWAENETSSNTAVISSSGDYSRVLIPLPLTLDGMIQGEITSLKYEFQGPTTWDRDFGHSARLVFLNVQDDIIQYQVYEEGNIKAIELDGPDNGTSSGTWTTSVIDLMVIESLSGGHYQAVLELSGQGDFGDSFEAGDTLEFYIEKYEPPENQIKSYTVWKIGAGIIGITFMILALGSTGLMNPLQKDNPGPIDRQYKQIRNRFKSKKR
jgi:hypothetical protein